MRRDQAKTYGVSETRILTLLRNAYSQNYLYLIKGGSVPIAIGMGADGGTRRPLGLVIVGGLIVSQLITLYVTPVMYLYLEVFQEKVLDRLAFFRRGHAPRLPAVDGTLVTRPAVAMASASDGHDGHDGQDADAATTTARSGDRRDR